MSLLRELSSQTGDRTEYSNRRVVCQCLDDPELLLEIVEGLKSHDAALVGDCAEVLTHVAGEHPEWIAPYAEELAPLLSSRDARVRWEAMHALAQVAHLAPDIIVSVLPVLGDILRGDKSVIARDQATDALAGYASTGEVAARAAFPLLAEMLTLWNGKHAGHALLGLVAVAKKLPEKHSELRLIAQEFLLFARPVVRKAARALQKELASIS